MSKMLFFHCQIVSERFLWCININLPHFTLTCQSLGFIRCCCIRTQITTLMWWMSKRITAPSWWNSFETGRIVHIILTTQGIAWQVTVEVTLNCGPGFPEWHVLVAFNSLTRRPHPRLMVCVRVQRCASHAYIGVRTMCSLTRLCVTHSA